jgi:hypothetical protein
MWKDRLELTPRRAWEMAAVSLIVVFVAGIDVIVVGSMAHARWKPEYAQNTQQVRDWFCLSSSIRPLNNVWASDGTAVARTETFSRRSSASAKAPVATSGTTSRVTRGRKCRTTSSIGGNMLLISGRRCLSTWRQAKSSASTRPKKEFRRCGATSAAADSG